MSQPGIQVLRIQDLAVVEELEVELGSGLNVLTGETGAGKSILVKALELVLGGRAAPELVRTGAKRAVVEALFELADGEEHVVKRTVSASGRSRAYVDGDLTTISVLRDRVRGWVDISSQHEHHTLVDPKTHLSWLDRFARHPELLDELADAVAAVRSAEESLAAFREQIRDRAERLDLLRFQLSEIERIDPQPDELDTVREELSRLEHLETLREAAEGAAHHVHGERAAVDRLVRAEQSLDDATGIDAALAPLLERLQSARLELEDIASELSDYASRLSSDPEKLSELQERERVLNRLERRHGSIDAALAHRAQVTAALEQLEDADHTESGLADAVKAALARADSLANALSERRRAHADALADAVSTELAALGMGAARIEVQVDHTNLSPRGIDQVEFLIAPNPGEAPRPLVKVASGGELSRALLALKQVLSGLGPVQAYVFDEVDTGVGGAVAEAIGRKLHDVARHHQVICITHQAVIAAWADRHLKVEKTVSDGRTRSAITALDAAGRREELARMLGGAEITAGVRQAATDLLKLPEARG
jgi:DNA repair protein RecN (Recombination protein N)